MQPTKFQLSDRPKSGRAKISVGMAGMSGADTPQLPPFSPAAVAHLDSIPANFTDAHAARVKELEQLARF